jgi:desulfoferrodoxin (superoxide reductase-like protein)
MKKIVLTLAIILAFSLNMKSDPAKKVNLKYSDGKLKIEALHKVKNVKTHYIDQITVKSDNKLIKTVQFKEQSSSESQVSEIELPNLKSGTKIEVETRCNEFGKKIGKLVI